MRNGKILKNWHNHAKTISSTLPSRSCHLIEDGEAYYFFKKSSLIKRHISGWATHCRQAMEQWMSEGTTISSIGEMISIFAVLRRKNRWFLTGPLPSLTNQRRSQGTSSIFLQPRVMVKWKDKGCVRCMYPGLEIRRLLRVLPSFDLVGRGCRGVSPIFAYIDVSRLDRRTHFIARSCTNRYHPANQISMEG